MAKVPQSLSIVTVCRDNPRAVVATLRSVYFQKSPPSRHIVVDSSGPQNRAEIKRLAEDHQAEYLWEKPAGIYHAMLTGLKQLPANNYVWFLNATDTMADRASVSTVTSSMRRAHATGHPAWFIGKTIVQTGDTWHTLSFQASPSDFTKALRRGGIGFPHSSNITHASLLAAVGAFQAPVTIAEDYRIGLALSELVGPPTLIHQAISIYDQSGLSAKQALATALAKSRTRRQDQVARNTLVEPLWFLRAPYRALLRWSWSLTRHDRIWVKLGWGEITPPRQSDHFCDQTSSQDWPECCQLWLASDGAQ